MPKQSIYPSNWLSVCLITVLNFLYLSTLIAKETTSQELPSCVLLPAQTGTIKSFTKDHTIILNDGRHLKLANIKLAAQIAHDQLESQLKRKRITFYASGRIKDRHNRFLAQIIILEGQTSSWLQEKLVRQGHAISYATAHNFSCMNQLLKTEKKSQSR